MLLVASYYKNRDKLAWLERSFFIYLPNIFIFFQSVFRFRMFKVVYYSFIDTP